MSLDPVVLGFLKEGPQTGYQLKKRIDNTVANFWTISYGGLYPALKRMKDEGVIRENLELSKQERGTYYELTEEGEKRFENWLNKEYKKVVIKDEFLLKIFFSSDEELVKLLPQINKRLREIESTLEVLEKIYSEDKKGKIESMTKGKRMTLQLGYEENRVEYEHIKKLRDKIKIERG